MHFSLLLICGLIVIVAVNTLAQKEQCAVTRNIGGIVGIGWDDLTNKPTLPIFPVTYDQNKRTPDGNFLVPDNVAVSSIKESNIQKSSSIYESFNSYKAEFGMSFNAGAGKGIPGLGSLCGAFSADMKIGKLHMEKNKETCFSNKIEYRAYNLIGTERIEFDKSFTDRLSEIIDVIKKIADYGTHVIDKAVAGASIAMNTFVSMSESTDASKIRAELSRGFEANFLGGSSSKAPENNGIAAMNESSQTYILTHGELDATKLFGASSEGNNKINLDSVVGLQKEGTLLYNLIHSGTLKGYDKPIVKQLQNLIYNATVEYYAQNMISGNPDSSASNYFYKANLNDGVSSETQKFKSFPGSAFNGGFFQKCEYISSSSKMYANLPQGNACQKYNHPNYIQHLTYSCPPGFIESELPSFYVTLKTRTHPDPNCTETCNSAITDELKITPYWCEYSLTETAHPDPIKFGGLFSSNNIFSDNGRCPGGFNEYPFYGKLIICLGRHMDKIEDNNGIIAFGGMLSCDKPYESCHYGYSRYHAATYDGCAYYYCAAIMPHFTLTTLQSIRKPPYIDQKMIMSGIEYSYRQKTKASDLNATLYHGDIDENY